MVTTAFELPEHQIKENLGIAKGISVRSVGWLGGIIAGFQSLRKGNVSTFTRLCEAARKEALELLLAEAEALGANAVIGVRYDTNEMGAIAEVFAYGTAVVVTKK